LDSNLQHLRAGVI